MTDADPRDQRQPGRLDRRKGPRRTEEVAEHYAREALLAAAVSWADLLDWLGIVHDDVEEDVTAAARLHMATRHWQEAVARVQETPR